MSANTDVGQSPPPLTSNYCLRFPVPVCLRQLPQTPPICIPCQGDLEAIEILKEFGNERQCPEYEISQASNLASGLSDIIIILERPRFHIDHPFNVDFNKFVHDCETLKAVDQLIRFASMGSRSIHMVTVLNTFSYQPHKNKRELDSKSEEILSRILQVKKPKAIIHCHNTQYTDSWMKRFNFPPGAFRLHGEIVEISDGHSAIVIPSFHPSKAVNYNKSRPEFQILLMYHFIDAFHSLSSEPLKKKDAKLPCYIERIYQTWCDVPGSVSDEEILKDWEIASKVAQLLEESYCDSEKKRPKGSRIIRLSDTTKEAKQQANMFGAVTYWSTLYLQNPDAFDLVRLVKAAFLLRQINLTSYPVYGRLFRLLLNPSIDYGHWFCDDKNNTVLHLSTQFLDLEVIKSPQLSSILQENQEVSKLTSEEMVKLDQMEETIDWNRCYWAIYYQKVSIEKYLNKFGNTSISGMIQIQELLVRCIIFTDISLNSRRNPPEKGMHLTPTQQKERLSELLSCLYKLRESLIGYPESHRRPSSI